mmetsp:Transcript_22764/g.53764  ORF Transcript_22764/g.53764 Transcript_22764/m.53764 type:complete len:465 (-) Transcript_22764:96-1490(-)|eukprot:CAMPEP_0172396576 /NCGR_PEP_ID=MMETSP1061-20121228/25927_1 /TAXON_ID=37318 /ORGANISM="Pseudo-nitzschia pungens, Strain cf. pungens" /LENGTH=464 /DNA_ID=CAMNT_0013128473 /DNA_START=80 /DNA_END=1474 /DNA_ORIENTATION=+
MSDNKLLHKIPEFVSKSYTSTEKLEALTMKEVKLPMSLQTHEVCWEPQTQSLFVTQMSDSLLVRFTVDEQGYLKDTQEAWQVGPANAGLHNASCSYEHPGHIWLTLQYMNLAFLVDVRSGDDFLKVKEIYQVPSWMFVDGKQLHIGGPHCVRECPVTGQLWACLKGAKEDENNPCAKFSQCCDVAKQRSAMEEHAKDADHDIAVPDSWAVWQLDRKTYDPKCSIGGKGGKIYPCLQSPPMCCTDDKGNCWIAQDCSPTLMWIDQKTGESEQIEVPWPAGTPDSIKHTGPGIAKAPNGSIWMTLLETNGNLVRVDPNTKECVLYSIKPPGWAQNMRLIHMDFCAASVPEHHNRIYVIASTLLDDNSTDCILVLNVCKNWEIVEGIRIIPLPSQRSRCHRIAYCDIDDGDNEVDDGSVFITELSRSKLLQVKMNDDVRMDKITETVSTNEQGFKVRRYECVAIEWK